VDRTILLSVENLMGRHLQRDIGIPPEASLLHLLDIHSHHSFQKDINFERIYFKARKTNEF
jgi:hypothetical protein